MTKTKNFNGQLTPSIIDTYYEECTFMQPNCINDGGQKKGARIFPGDDTPRHFKGCNLVNCELPPGSTIDHCNTGVVGRGVIKNSENVIIDGETITVNDYVSRTYGKYNPETESYVYFSPYRDVQEEQN